MTSSSDTYVLFELGGTTYALRSNEVQHMEMITHITPVPNTAAAVEGVIFSRGQVIPAMNLRVRFGLPAHPHTDRSRLIVVQLKQRHVGLIVDSAREFRRIPDDSIRPIQEAVTGIDGNYLKGICTTDNRMILILDVAAVLDVPGGTQASLEAGSSLQTSPLTPQIYAH